MINAKASAKKQPKQANAAGKTRNVDKQKIKSSKNLKSLLSMGSALRIRTKARENDIRFVLKFEELSPY